MSVQERKYRDGGYGWVVVMASFLVGFITDGITFSFGILLVNMVEQFKSERGETAVVGALVTGTMHMVGPVAGSLRDSYGYRTVVISGALLSAAGIAASMFVTKLPLLYVTYGLLGGTGFGLMYQPACVCVIHNFLELRTLANGVAVCGSGAGMFVFNVVNWYTLDMYGLKGTFLIQSGVCLNGIVFGLLLNDPDNKYSELESDTTGQRETTCTSSSITDQRVTQYNSIDTRSSNIPKEDIQTELASSIEDTTLKETNLRPSQTFKHNERTELLNDKAGMVMNRDLLENKCKVVCRRLTKAFAGMCDMGLLRNCSFSTFLLSSFLINFAFNIPIHLLPDQAEQLGIPRQEAAWLTSVIGLGNTLGRIMFGWLGDRKHVNRFVTLIACLLVCGISTGLSPLLATFGPKVLYACVYGLLVGGYVTLVTVVLADMIGVDNISKGFGLNLFVSGVSGSIGSPVGGWLFDVTGNYDTTFIFAGIVFVISGLVLTPPKLCTYWKKRYSNDA